MADARSEEIQRIIYDGVPITTLGEIFGLDHKEVNKRLVGRVASVKSTNPKDKVVRYRIRDAAPYLCEMKMDPEEMIKNISPSKLPPALQDAFWKAQNSRQKWEENRGDLWRTARVFEVMGSAFKAIRLTILMFMDTTNQRTELTQEQRRIINDLSDGLLLSLTATLRDNFSQYEKRMDEHGMPLTADDNASDTPELDARGAYIDAHPETDPFDETPEVDPFA